ncbi:glucose 1-dehydrogenase [Devosia sp. ZB163]|uniref:glucose 1-dehydrogenase n=1 Tax=Devosia sp. ZB163 TaxID=3025938 RepID=UPI00235E7C50|nr:glucose 1-dehydrogenase [Devosia sp. ZB163]MDC9824510.1 glucose 1-dehydrogenase [Devosia sp. ZB163]
MDSISQFNLKGRRALVTGSSRGIGYGIAEALAGAGAEIIINSRNPEALGEAAARLAEGGALVKALAFDVTSEDSVEDAISHAETEIGPIDILVNNAGMQHRASLETWPLEKFEQVMSTNVTSAFLVSRAVVRGMIERRRGRIINICSVLSNFARSSVAPYSASKAALANLTRGMAVDWAKHGINVNGISPGYIATELNEALLKNEEFNAWIEKRTPMGRWGQPAELGGAAVFLASDASSFVNGHILYVDGAFTATV